MVHWSGRNTSPPLIIALHNDAIAHTLTATSGVLDPSPFTMGDGESPNQSPPADHLASVQGNAGQLSYSYPLQVAPGTGGFAPQLTLSYSSGDPNERHSPTSPANDVGDGWTLSLGSISADTYPNTGTTWYFISGVANVGDRLIPNGSLYDTEHLSYLRITQVTKNGQPCFEVWDKSGTNYELGCTTDSLQYWNDSNGRHNYRWDVDKIIAPNEGPNAGIYKMLTVSYLQDVVTSGGYTSIRDAVMKQILYGTGDTNSVTAVAGTVDFFYRGASDQPPWAQAYGNNANYNCSSAPPINTSLRCDDPVQMPGGGTFPVPTVMSTYSLQTVTSYVGSDTNYKDYSYNFTYTDNPFQSCNDPVSLLPGYCAREHLLMSITPTVYQNNTAHQLPQVLFGYTNPLQNTYYDSRHQVGNPPQQYFNQTWWQYLNLYRDINTGVGGQINYTTAYNNTHGTPTYKNGQGQILDDRYDPLYCINQQNNPGYECTGNWAHPDDEAWAEQVVTQIITWSQDSSSSSLQRATTTYGYRLAKTGTWGGGNSTFCAPDQYNVDKDCVGDNWIPNGDTDWVDYSHAEYQGFNQVYITSPATDLTVDSYYSTEGWKTPGSDYQNFQGGSLYEEDVYSGNSASSTALLSSTVNTYGNNSNACRSTSQTYPACITALMSTQTTQYERTGSNNSNAPWVEHQYTYDDYEPEYGLSSPAYHNLVFDAIFTSNASPDSTKEWDYSPNDQVKGTWTYYTVDKVTHSEVHDSNSHVWLCQDTTYDEGAPTGTATPSAGWPTTVKTYTDCTNSSTAITSYQDYDAYGNPVATVDGVASANSGLYTNNGCSLSTNPVILSSGWGQTRYTACTVYDSTYNALPITQTNAFGQQSSIGYDNTQGELPTSATDVNGQMTTTKYNYDGSGNRTVQVKEPNENGAYTSQSKTTTNCAWNSTLPCFEIDNNSFQYSGAITRTFYDSLGRQVETRTPGPTPGDDTIVMTVYNDQLHTVWQSVPFEVASGNSWLDPNGAVDINNVAPGGTVTFYDALNRPLATQDPLYGTGADQIACSQVLSGTYTSCTNYSLGSPSGSTTVYATIQTVDPNLHVTVAYEDALGRTAFTEEDSGKYVNGANLSANEQVQFQYNALDKPTSVTTIDLVPQTGQSITSVTTSMQYDDKGRLTQLVDPDAGTHTYTYDPDGHMLSDVISTQHTLGYNYDLLGRVGCVQDAAPNPTQITARGGCTAGNPLIQNSYDSTFLGVQGTTDFPIGQLGKSLSTTYYPEGTSANVTEKFQHDARGRLTQENLLFGLPSAWGVSTALPTYKLNLAYNDANQVTTTTTSSAGPAGLGYTSTQVYDPNMGALTGLSNNGNNTANLATIGYNARAGIDTIFFQTSTGSALANEQFGYDANLRTTSLNTTWQSGSGQSGPLLTQGLSYDPASNVVSLSTAQAAVPGAGNGGSETQNFCYDEQNRLVWAGNSGTQPSPGSGTCGSGILGNHGDIGAYSNSFVYTHLGQLWQGPTSGGSTQYQYLYCTSSAPHQLSGLYALGSTCTNENGQGYASTYDAYGNVTGRTYSGTTAALSYNTLDQLVEWNAGSSNQEWYVYDASGNRVLKRSTNGSGTTLMVYAFGREEHQYSGTGTNQWNTYYLLGSQLIGDLDANGTFFLLTDALDSLLSDISWAAGGASIKANQVFGPYGNARAVQGNINTAKGFTGQYNDSLTGLDYYVSRYYDPVVGVFLSADPVQGNQAGMNPYGYVGGNPETYADPTGRRYIGENGNYGNIDPQGNLSIWIPIPWYAGGSGFNENGNYAYQKFSYTKAQLQQPISQPPPSVQGNFWQQTLEFFDLLARQLPGALNSGMACGADFMLSFAPSTKVATSQGAKPIGSLRPGETVWAYNPKTHKMELQPIVHIWINHDDDLVDLTITSTISRHGKPTQRTSEVIHTNKKHPFLTVEEGFVSVSQLRIGMHVVNADGGVGTITRLKTVPGVMTMYNLEVAQDHTYVVGSGKWVVHNCSISTPTFDNRFAGMAGAPYSELITLIPAGARFSPFTGKSGMQGFKWNWKETGADGLSYSYEFRMHSPDPDAIAKYPDSNAAQGWTWRLERTGGTDPANPKSQGKGTWYMDAEGNWLKESQMTQEEINATHIPTDTPTPEEMQWLQDTFGPPLSP